MARLRLNLSLRAVWKTGCNSFPFLLACLLACLQSLDILPTKKKYTCILGGGGWEKKAENDAAFVVFHYWSSPSLQEGSLVETNKNRGGKVARSLISLESAGGETRSEPQAKANKPARGLAHPHLPTPTCSRKTTFWPKKEKRCLAHWALICSSSIP